MAERPLKRGSPPTRHHRYLALGRIPEAGGLAAGVPGIVEAGKWGWRFGTRPLGALLEDAINYAEAGG